MISIIIPTYNKDARLKIMLHFLSQIEMHNNVELIIVNDGSTDKTKEIIQNYINNLPIKHFQNTKIFNVKNQGRSSARNIGLSAAQNDLILFLDDDIIVHPKIISNYINIKNNDKRLVIRGKIYELPYLKFFNDPTSDKLNDGTYAKNMLSEKKMPDTKDFYSLYKNYLKQNIKISKFENDVKNVFDNTDENDSHIRWFGSCGANLFLNKELLFKINGFDEKFGTSWGCEDLELGYRLYKLGNARFNISEDSIGYHLTHYRSNYAENHQRNMCYFINKHNDKNIELLGKYFAGDCDISTWIINGKNKPCNHLE